MPPTSKPRQRRLNKGEYERLEQASHLTLNPHIWPIIVFAIETGMRRSEISGLKWDAVDTDRRALMVVRTLQRITGMGLVEGTPKTAKSQRSIDLGKDAVELLNRIRVTQAETRLKLGGLWEDQGFVFTLETGRPIDPDEVTNEFRDLVRNNSLPHLTFHGLRHAHATLLLSSGIQPKVISERLGHSNISITMDIYSHVLPSLQREAADTIDRLLASAP